jgi:ABC transporter substrate binding protein (PQQ-dependent alcohol dehydrogenase system)
MSKRGDPGSGSPCFALASLWLVLLRVQSASACALAVVLAMSSAAVAGDLKIGYLDRAGDPAFTPSAGYTGVYRRNHDAPRLAADLAMKDGAAAARAAGMQISIEYRTLSADETADLGAEELMLAGVAAIILDLPLDDTKLVAQKLSRYPLVLINARHRDDDLRIAACRTALLHTMPAQSMLTDALAQGLLALDWRRILILRGPTEGDIGLANRFSASAKKFGVHVVDTRNFAAGNDPRKRDQINIRLLTGNADYDAIFVADLVGDFARTVPYNTARARPVVGSAGLQASAWHPYWERHGAPQLNRRFHRLANRQMSDEDWATWTGVRMILDAAIAARDPAPATILKTLLGPDLRIELYKALPGSIRSWSRQLRQAILLGTADAVITLAPVDNALHQRNILDTLGPDEPEFKCPG